MSSEVKLVEQSHAIIEAEGLLKVEKAARTCYKSEIKIKCENEDRQKRGDCDGRCGYCEDHSSYAFVNKMMKLKHEAMLEHINFIFKVNSTHAFKTFKEHTLIQDLRFINETHGPNGILISMNLRALRDLIILTNHEFSHMLLNAVMGIHPNVDIGLPSHILASVNYSGITNPVMIVHEDILTPMEAIHHKYITMDLSTDLGTIICILRHRLNAFAQESTRWVEYEGLTFVKPVWASDLLDKLFATEAVDSTYVINELMGTEEELLLLKDSSTTEEEKGRIEENILERYLEHPDTRYWESCLEDQHRYLDLIESGWQSEEARQVLPKGLKASLIVTGNVREWLVMSNIRKYGLTGKPHQQIKALFDGIMLTLSNEYPELFGKAYEAIIRQDLYRKEHPTFVLKMCMEAIGKQA